MSHQDKIPEGSLTKPPVASDGGGELLSLDPANIGSSNNNNGAGGLNPDVPDNERPEGSGDGGLAIGALGPGGSADTIDRFARNATALQLGKGNSSDTTENANAGGVRIPTREGVYGRGRFTPKTRKGKKIVDADPGLFPFNYVVGRRSESVLSVGKDDRMSPSEAKEKLLGILAMFGVECEAHEYLYTFTHALLVAHALNGASVAGPGRATFSVDGDIYPYGDVVKYLGPDARRFYRAFADETAKALLLVLQSFDPSNCNSVMLCGQIRSIAVSKKLTQYPYLIHDSADACYRTNVSEMAAITGSKSFVLNSGSSGDTIEKLERQVEG